MFFESTQHQPHSEPVRCHQLKHIPTLHYFAFEISKYHPKSPLSTNLLSSAQLYHHFHPCIIKNAPVSLCPYDPTMPFHTQISSISIPIVRKPCYHSSIDFSGTFVQHAPPEPFGVLPLWFSTNFSYRNFSQHVLDIWRFIFDFEHILKYCANTPEVSHVLLPIQPNFCLC